MCVRATLAKGMLGLSRLSVKFLRGALFRRFNPDSVPRHIVVYRIGNLGDTVTALPALQQIREAFPDAFVTWLTSSGRPDLPGAALVLEVFPGLVDAIESYDSAHLKTRDGVKTLKAALTERAGPIDLFIDLSITMQTWRRNVQELYLATALGSPEAIGFAQIFPPVFRPQWNLENAACIPQTSQWLQAMLHREGLPDSKNWPKPALQDLTPILERTGLQADQPLLLVNAGAKLAIKRWPVTAFAQVIQAARSALPHLQVGLLGSADEQVLNETLRQNATEGVMNLAGQLTIAETFALMTQAKAVLSNDTGTMHMAGILGLPVVAPMAGQFPDPLWHPARSETTEFKPIRHDVPCAPCFLEQCRYAEQTCLLGITPESVTAELMPLLQ